MKHYLMFKYLVKIIILNFCGDKEIQQTPKNDEKQKCFKIFF